MGGLLRGRQKRTKRPSLAEDRAASVPTLEQYSRMVDEMCRNFVEQQEKELQAYMEQQEKEADSGAGMGQNGRAL